MAVCETTHWILDCGEGHGCGLAEFSDTGELASWFCSSELVKGRRRPREDEATYLDGSAKLEFCCHDVPRAALAEVLDDLVEAELVVPKGKYAERVTYSATATLDEIIGGVGLSVRA
jgi:hypothetical protein